MCKRWLATVIQWSPRRTAVWRHGGRRPRWLVEHIYVCVCVWFCACGWDGGARGIQFGGWVDPVGLAASLNQENEWEPTQGVTPFLCCWPPLISLSPLCSSLLSSLFWPPRQRKQLKLQKWTQCLTICLTACCKVARLCLMTWISRRRNKCLYHLIKWLEIHSKFSEAAWCGRNFERLNFNKSKTAPPNGRFSQPQSGRGTSHWEVPQWEEQQKTHFNMRWQDTSMFFCDRK